MFQPTYSTFSLVLAVIVSILGTSAWFGVEPRQRAAAAGAQCFHAGHETGEKGPVSWSRLVAEGASGQSGPVPIRPDRAFGSSIQALEDAGHALRSVK